MTRSTVACFLLFVTAVLPAASDEPGPLSFSFTTGPGMSVVSDARFAGAEGQLTLPAILSFNAELNRRWSWHLATGYRYTAPSPPGINEVSYSGHNDFLLGLGGAFRFLPLYEDTLFRINPGLRLTGYAHIAAKQYTSVYYFYPSLELMPFARLLRWREGFLVLSAGLPLRLDFRRGLEYSFSLGLLFDIALFLPDN
jgi:hypothetical protein